MGRSRYNFSAVLKAGLIGGIVAGAILGALIFVVMEPLIDEALLYEEVPVEEEEEPEPVPRDLQRTYPVIGGIIAGIPLMLIFGLFYGTFYRILPGKSAISKALVLGIASFIVLSLVLFFKYPADPPGLVNDLDVSTRIAGRAGLQIIAALGLVVPGALIWKLERSRGSKYSNATRATGVVVIFLLFVIAAILLLPADIGFGATPPELIFQFRVLSVVNSLVFWVIGAAVFGAVWTRFNK
ncbi:MAG: CbtA family protein [Candidatus Bathyarchaeia archaeon]